MKSGEWRKRNFEASTDKSNISSAKPCDNAGAAKKPTRNSVDNLLTAAVVRFAT